MLIKKGTLGFIGAMVGLSLSQASASLPSAENHCEKLRDMAIQPFYDYYKSYGTKAVGVPGKKSIPIPLERLQEELVELEKRVSTFLNSIPNLKTATHDQDTRCRVLGSELLKNIEDLDKEIAEFAGTTPLAVHSQAMGESHPSQEAAKESPAAYKKRQEMKKAYEESVRLWK